MAEMVGPMLGQSVQMTYGQATVEDILKCCVEGDMQLWVVCKDKDLLAVIVTEIAQLPRKRVFIFRFCGGEKLGEWVKVMDNFLNWARSQGCDQAEIYGRKGWGRIYRDYGYEEIASCFHRSL